MASRQPLISVITPSYNQGEYIQDTIESVLNQDYGAIDYIVVDAVSTDQTSRVLELDRYKNRIDIVSEKDEGQVDGLLKGLSRAQGQIVTWLNADDVYVYRDTLSKVAESFFRYPDVTVISGSSVLLDAGNRLLQVYRAFPKFSGKQLLLYDYIRQPATFFRSSVIGSALLDRSLTCAFDYDLWLKLSKKFKFLMVGDILAGIRRHPQMKTIRLREKMREESLAVRSRYGVEGEISPFDRVRGVGLRAINKAAGLRLIAEIYRRAADRAEGIEELAVPITFDGLFRTCLRQLLNHKGIRF